MLIFFQFPFIDVKGNLSVGILSWSFRSNFAFWKSLASSSEADEAETGRAEGPGIGTVGFWAGGPKFSTSSKSWRGSGKSLTGF